MPRSARAGTHRVASDAERALSSELPWNEMRGLRNKVAHEYFGIDAAIIWQTATADLPPLKAPLETAGIQRVDNDENGHLEIHG